MQEFHFPNWVNKFTLILIFGGLGVGGYLATCLFAAIHPTVVNPGYAPRQPVPFSHQIHAGQLGLDCRYCHNTVETAAHAAIPPTATCGNCHGGDRVEPGATLGIVHADSTLLAPVRSSLESEDPVMWVKVHDVPDYVYFNHSVHVKRGVGCETCHGRIDTMDIVTQVEPLSMKWCLDCHRQPENHLRDPEFVTKMGFVPPVDQQEYGAQIRAKYEINPKVNCSTCHR